MKAQRRWMMAPLLGLAALLTTACEPPETVDYVDVERYLGTWYEIASYPAFFQRDCFGGTTATYEASPDRDDEILVRNECRVGSLDGETQVATARARIADQDTNAKLKVYFSWFPGDYWIIDLDPAPGDQPYEWAVVSEGTRSFLWILSRTPTIDDDTLAGILDRLEDQGFDLDRLRWTPQQ